MKLLSINGNTFHSDATGDDVVAYEHGKRSAQTLSSAGFQNLTFRTYNGYSNYLQHGVRRLIFVLSEKLVSHVQYCYAG